MNCVGIQKDLHLFLVFSPSKRRKEIELVKKYDKNSIRYKNKNEKTLSFWTLFKNCGF